ncbi:MAG: hypothetical protein IPP33_01890 [Flavobacteriales bacterium]|nr:hypothetical protein [Flavobacteriales bacterium]
MSRGWLVVTGFCFVTWSASAQDPDSLSGTPTKADTCGIMAWPLANADHFLRFEAKGFYDSNTLRNDLVLGLWQGATLDRETRQRSEGRTDQQSRAGYALEGNLSYAWGDSLWGNGNMRPRISITYHDVMGLRFSDDLYRTTFFGNADFENATAELAPTALEQVRYQTFGFGIEDKETRSFLMLQLVNGQSLNAARIDRADLFTAIDGRYLRLDLEGNYARSDTAAPPGLSNNGIGAALGAEVNQRFNLCHREASFTFGIQDLGAIVWNENSLRVPKDSILVYEGIQVDDVFDLNASITGSTDLQDSLGLGYVRGAFLRLLPVRMNARVSIKCAHQFELSAEVDVRNLPGYYPHGSLGVEHSFAERNSIRGEVSYGGFGGWRTGVGYQRLVGKNLLVGLLAPNLIGLLSDRARGRALAIDLQYAW